MTADRVGCGDGLATKLGVDDFKAWAEKELAGYGRESTPPYRRVQCEIPEPPSLPTKVWINLPSRDESVAQLVH